MEKHLPKFLKILSAILGFIVVYLILTGDTWSQELEKYQPIGVGVCEDVQLPCVKLVLKETDIFFAVFKDGKLIAITRLRNGKEEVIWGELKLPLKKGETDI